MGKLDVIVQRLDASLLTTIERMGVGVPVLLITADLEGQRCHFVCLNDYLDKILIPRFGPEATVSSRSIELPVANVLAPRGGREDVLRWYGKRAKLYAAFQRFVYQNGNLREEQVAHDIIALAKIFGSRIARYDFWTDTATWEVLAHFGKALHHFLLTEDATNIRLDPRTDAERARQEQSRPNVNSPKAKAADILRLWDLLASLPGNYEDICREWFLPTAIGYRVGFGTSGVAASFEDKFRIPRLE